MGGTRPGLQRAGARVVSRSTARLNAWRCPERTSVGARAHFTGSDPTALFVGMVTSACGCGDGAGTPSAGACSLARASSGCGLATSRLRLAPDRVCIERALHAGAVDVRSRALVERFCLSTEAGRHSLPRFRIANSTRVRCCWRRRLVVGSGSGKRRAFPYPRHSRCRAKAKRRHPPPSNANKSVSTPPRGRAGTGVNRPFTW